MNKLHFRAISKAIFTLIFLFSFISSRAQNQYSFTKSKSNFLSKIQFGGGFGLNIGSGFTNISVAPSAIYNFNQYFSAGIGLQYSFINEKNNYSSHLYGGSIIALVNPIPEIQLSAELEQLRVNINFVGLGGSDNFWNTGLFLGAGYRNGNVTIGGRYNVLFNENTSPYRSAFVPFLRVYF